MHRAIASVLITILAAWAALPLRAEILAPAPGRAQLVMVEEQGCIWCEMWNEEVGPEYPITPEGLAAPLRRIDLHEPVPADLTLDGSLQFTPTFILVVDGREVSRLEGYPGEGFFWGLLDRMLKDAGVQIDDGTG